MTGFLREQGFLSFNSHDLENTAFSFLSYLLSSQAKFSNIRIDGQPISKADVDLFFTDCEVDPEEKYNFKNEPKYRDIIKKLSEQLDAHCATGIEIPDDF